MDTQSKVRRFVSELLQESNARSINSFSHFLLNIYIVNDPSWKAVAEHYKGLHTPTFEIEWKG